MCGHVGRLGRKCRGKLSGPDSGRVSGVGGGGWGRWDCRAIVGINKRLDPLIPPAGAIPHFCRIDIFYFLPNHQNLHRGDMMKQDDDRVHFDAGNVADKKRECIRLLHSV